MGGEDTDTTPRPATPPTLLLCPPPSTPPAPSPPVPRARPLGRGGPRRADMAVSSPPPPWGRGGGLGRGGGSVRVGGSGRVPPGTLAVGGGGLPGVCVWGGKWVPLGLG